MTPDAKPVRFERRPIVMFVSGNAIIGWCVWIERTEYDDGTVTIEYRSHGGAS